MRRYITAICVVGLVGASAAAVASASAPAPNRSFSGHGGIAWRQNGAWVRHGTASFSFRTSGKHFFQKKPYWYINNFRGSYTTSSCTTGTVHVTASNVFVNHKGDYSFTFTHKGIRVTISGFFSSPGTARVQYIARFPSGCQTRVRGPAFAS